MSKWTIDELAAYFERCADYYEKSAARATGDAWRENASGKAEAYRLAAFEVAHNLAR